MRKSKKRLASWAAAAVKGDMPLGLLLGISHRGNKRRVCFKCGCRFKIIQQVLYAIRLQSTV
jgi:hypothetical protein